MFKLLNLILRVFKIELIAVPMIGAQLMESAKMIIGQTGAMEGSGEFKRAQALRALMNRHPEARERECALAIELAVCSEA